MDLSPSKHQRQLGGHQALLRWSRTLNLLIKVTRNGSGACNLRETGLPLRGQKLRAEYPSSAQLFTNKSSSAYGSQVNCATILLLLAIIPDEVLSEGS